MFFLIFHISPFTWFHKEGTYTKYVVHPSGSPQNPWSYDDCANKFRDCASYSTKPLSKEAVESIINRIEKLEDLPDVAEIMAEVN